MSEGLVSILVPVYNGSKYLIEFLDSIDAQTYRPLQLLIADDCSRDDSLQICEQWAKNHEGREMEILCYRNEQNFGLSQNVSKLLSKAKGEFIFIADQDDVWRKGKVEIQAEYMRQHPDCMISLCDRSVANEKMQIMIESEYKYYGYKISTMNFEEVIKHPSIYAANTMAIRNNGSNIFNIPEGVVQHDTFITVMAARYGTVDFLFEPLMIYRIHRNNLSANYISQFSKNRLECFLKYYKRTGRIGESAENDARILEREFYERFHVSLRSYENKVLKQWKIRPVKYAWEQMMGEYKAGKIGIWLNTTEKER